MSEQAVLEAAPPTVVDRMAGPRRRRWLPFDRWHLFLFPFALVMLFPMTWMLVSSVERLAETRHFPPIPPPVLGGKRPEGQVGNP